MTTFTGSIPTIASGDTTTVPTNLATYRDVHKALTEAWSTWVPTITAGSGTFTTVSTTSARYLRANKLIIWSAIFQITTAGTAAAGFRFTLPATPHAGSVNVGCGRESASTGFVLATNHIGAGVCEITKYDNTTIIANGRTLNMSGTFEVA